MMMAEKSWLTYAEAAAALGLSIEGVRQRARREHWRKMLGNEGKALVMLPEDAARAPAGEADGDRSSDKPSINRAPPKPPAGEVEALQSRIAELRTDLERERVERERERSERLGERDRADRLAGEVTEHNRRLASLVEELKELAVVRERLAAANQRHKEDAARHTEELRQTKAALEEWKARPWWKRLAG